MKNVREIEGRQRRTKMRFITLFLIIDNVPRDSSLWYILAQIHDQTWPGSSAATAKEHAQSDFNTKQHAGLLHEY